MTVYAEGGRGEIENFGFLSDINLYNISKKHNYPTLYSKTASFTDLLSQMTRIFPAPAFRLKSISNSIALKIVFDVLKNKVLKLCRKLLKNLQNINVFN